MSDFNPLAPQLLDLARPVAPGLSEVHGDPMAADLRQAGLSSIAAARLMLEIEAAFNIAIPDAELTPENFATLGSIERLLVRLGSGAVATCGQA